MKTNKQIPPVDCSLATLNNYKTETKNVIIWYLQGCNDMLLDRENYHNTLCNLDTDGSINNYISKCNMEIESAGAQLGITPGRDKTTGRMKFLVSNQENTFALLSANRTQASLVSVPDNRFTQDTIKKSTLGQIGDSTECSSCDLMRQEIDKLQQDKLILQNTISNVSSEKAASIVEVNRLSKELDGQSRLLRDLTTTSVETQLRLTNELNESVRQMERLRLNDGAMDTTTDPITNQVADGGSSKIWKLEPTTEKFGNPEDVRDINQWFFTIEQQFKKDRVPEEIRVAMISTFLRGKAAVAYRHYVIGKEAKNQTPDWLELKRVLKAEFESPHKLHENQTKLRMLKHEDSFMAYVRKFKHLVNECNDHDEEKLIQWFTQALKPEYLYQYRERCPSLRIETWTQ